MKNNWNKIEVKKYIKEYAKKNIDEDLALRIYTTHLLGKNKKLVLHGGGNTSVKSELKDIFQNKQKVIYVKGSGWDMSNLNELGLPRFINFLLHYLFAGIGCFLILYNRKFNFWASIELYPAAPKTTFAAISLRVPCCTSTRTSLRSRS